MLYFLAQSFRSQLIKELPESRSKLSGESLALAFRAKELLILVGDDQVVARMAANDRQQRRYSGLRARLARGGPEKEENHGPAPISSEPALPTQVSLL